MSAKEVLEIVAPRKRGRPQGKGRAPLSLEEKRARNALYEKQRRAEQSQAMVELAAAIGCSTQMTEASILANVINFLKTATSSRYSHSNLSNDKLKRINENLEQQIASIELRLMSTSSSEEDVDPSMLHNK